MDNLCSLSKIVSCLFFFINLDFVNSVQLMKFVLEIVLKLNFNVLLILVSIADVIQFEWFVYAFLNDLNNYDGWREF